MLKTTKGSLLAVLLFCVFLTLILALIAIKYLIMPVLAAVFISIAVVNSSNDD